MINTRLIIILDNRVTNWKHGSDEYSDATYMRLQTICFAPPSIFLNVCSRADSNHKRRLKTAESLAHHSDEQVLTKNYIRAQKASKRSEATYNLS